MFYFTCKMCSNKVTAQVTLDRMKLPHFMKGQGVKLFKLNRHRVLLQPNSLDRTARLQTSNGFFCSVNHLSGGGVNANHNSPSLAHKNKTENDSRLLKNSEGNRDDEWTFCRGQGADIALFLKKTRIGKIRKIFEENQSI